MSELSDERIQELIAIANRARENAYAPYSNFHVGAALLGRSGTVYPGTNFENASYPAGTCAERTALGQAITAGEREFVAVVVVTDTKTATSPCGICRQALSEFGDLTVVMASPTAELARYRISELLPASFGPANLAQHREETS